MRCVGAVVGLLLLCLTGCPPENPRLLPGHTEWRTLPTDVGGVAPAKYQFLVLEYSGSVVRYCVLQEGDQPVRLIEGTMSGTAWTKEPLCVPNHKQTLQWIEQQGGNKPTKKSDEQYQHFRRLDERGENSMLAGDTQTKSLKPRT